MLHRRHLPVVTCPVIEQVIADGVGGHCRHCEKQVHDLSAMTEGQARRLLRDQKDPSICVAYRVRPDGTLHLRRSETWKVLPLTVLLAAGCASLGGNLEVPDDPLCKKDRGHRVDCEDRAFAGYAWSPDLVDDPFDDEPPDEETEAGVVSALFEEHTWSVGLMFATEASTPALGTGYPGADPVPPEIATDRVVPRDFTRVVEGAEYGSTIVLGGLRISERARRFHRRERRRVRRAARKMARTR